MKVGYSKCKTSCSDFTYYLLIFLALGLIETCCLSSKYILSGSPSRHRIWESHPKIKMTIERTKTISRYIWF